MRHKLAATVALGLFGVMLVAWAQPNSDTPAKPANATEEELAVQQALVAARYRQLEETLLRIAQVLERRNNPGDIEKARIIHRALREARERKVYVNLNDIAESLKRPSTLSSLKDIQTVVDKGGDVETAMRKLLEILLAPDDESLKKKEMEFYAELIRKLEEAERAQRVAQARNDNPDIKKEDAQKAHQVASRMVDDILNRIRQFEGGGQADPSRGEARDAGKNERPDAQARGDARSGQGKPGEARNEGQGAPNPQARNQSSGEKPGGQQSQEQAQARGGSPNEQGGQARGG
ncbi:MAG: hypothetical protein RMJ19_12485, partial [Gemmatales bacterium]|nr:hypothetical protein [Gemmatales bacterium]MDW8176483.1 hypothetical protein [Gemmatales bacterium]